MNKIIRLYIIPLFVLFFVFCGGGIGVPELLDPTGGESVDLPVNLIWSAVENAESYYLEVATNTDFSAWVILAGVNDTSYTVTGLDTLMYYWRVAAIDENGDTSDFSDPDSFQITGYSYPRTLITTINVMSTPQSIDITPDGSELWVNHWGQTDTCVYVISTASNQVTHQIPVTNVGDTELRISADGAYTYFCGVWNMDSAGILELSTSSYTQTRMLGFTQGSPPVKVGPEGYGIALTQANDYIYAAHMATAGDGCITKFDVSSGTMTDSILLPWIMDVDLNHAENKLYAVSQDEDYLYEIDPNTMTVNQQIALGSGPQIILITSDDHYAFVSHLNDSVYVVDLTSFTVVHGFDPGIGVFGMKMTPNEHYLFMCDDGSNYIGVADVTDPTDVKMVDVLEFSSAGSFSELVFNSDGSRAYVVETGGDIYVLGK